MSADAAVALDIEATICDFVDRWSIRGSRVMSDAKGGEDQYQLALTQLDYKDHAELAIRWREAQLHAVTERGSIRSLLIASQEIRDWHPTCLVLLAGCASHLYPCLTSASHILGEGSVIK